MYDHILLALVLCAAGSVAPTHARELASRGTDGRQADLRRTSFRVDGDTADGREADIVPDRPGLEKVYVSRGLEVYLADAAGKNLDCVGDSDFKLGSGEFLLLGRQVQCECDDCLIACREQA